MSKKLLNQKALVSSSILALVITLFIGCFANAPANMDESFSGKYWYYLNRGYPEPWAGLALANSKVNFPLVRMPFLHAEDGKGIELVKIIDLSRFMPIFALTLLVSYIPSFVFAKAVDKNKKLLSLLVITDIGLLAILLFVYFSWFSRV